MKAGIGNTIFNLRKDSGGGSGETKFVMEVTVTAGDLDFKIDTGQNPSAFGIDYNVDWGDNSNDTNLVADITHTYPSAGTYEIKIDGRFAMNNQAGGVTNALKITKLKNWGTAECEFISLYRMFMYCRNMTYEATDYPDTSNITSLGTGPFLTEMFRECYLITDLDLTNWQNTSSFTRHSSMFYRCRGLETLNLTGWDFSNSASLDSTFIELGRYSATGGCILTAPNLDLSSMLNTGLNATFSNANLSTGSNIDNWTLPTGGQVWSASFYSGQVGGSFWSDFDFLTTWTNKIPTGSIRAFRGERQDVTTSMDISGFDWSNNTDFRELFMNNEYLERITGLNTLDSTSMASFLGLALMFSNNRNLQNIDEVPQAFWAGFSGGNCTGLFQNVGVWTTGVNEPNLGTASFTGCTNWTSAFQGVRFNSDAGLSNFQYLDMSAVTGQNLYAMFWLARGINTIDASNWGFTNSLTSLFRLCRDSEITSVDFGTGTTNDFSAITRMQDFSFGSDITSIIFPTNVDFGAITNMTNFASSGGRPLTVSQYDHFLIRFDATNTNSGITLSMGVCDYTLGSVADGTTDGTTTNKLVDSSQNFTTSVNIGDIVIKGSETGFAKVTNVDNDTTLTLDVDIFISGDAYNIGNDNAVKAKYEILQRGNTIVDGNPIN